jgi:NAD(P)-dependent dehydrogenase (short-subunit alcohol dehydrogenase family)
LISAMSHRPGSRLDRIRPGALRGPAAQAAREAATPLRRLGEPEDIAGVALMLASRAGAFITGQAIIVDGGMTIAP